MKFSDEQRTLTADLRSLPSLAEAIVAYLPNDAIVLLQGDLAAGKTTLVKAIVAALGIDADVSSPTFSLQHSYTETLHHYDLYRIDEEEFARLGLLEELEKPGLHLVEWGSDALAERLRAYGFEVYRLAIEGEGDRRSYRFLE